MLVKQIPYRKQIVPQGRFPRPQHGSLIRRHRKRGEDTHDRDDGHELDNREAARLFALQLRLALVGASKESVLSAQPLEPLSAKVGALAEGKYRHKSRDAVRGTGYCVESLEAALWCFAQSSSFKEAVLLAANLGDDADTTAAICGQLSGAFYGVQGIPQEWRDKLVMFAEMNEMAHQLLALSERR